jgi:hypothetical protein
MTASLLQQNLRLSPILPKNPDQGSYTPSRSVTLTYSRDAAHVTIIARCTKRCWEKCGLAFLFMGK